VNKKVILKAEVFLDNDSQYTKPLNSGLRFQLNTYIGYVYESFIVKIEALGLGKTKLIQWMFLCRTSYRKDVKRYSTGYCAFVVIDLR